MPTNGKLIIPQAYSDRQQDGLISLYFHIPFCTKKCHYCHFFVLPDQAESHKKLLEGLRLEMAQWTAKLKGKKLASIYFGGGTPSLLDPKEIQYLLEEIQANIPYDPSQIEITLEANPETISPEKMRNFSMAGINRVSIGFQTLDDHLLEKLGRTHKAQTSIDCIKMTADAGISNISIDLMYDIPGQTLASWQHTLEQVIPLPITHLSLYNLTIEPHTVFFKYQESLKKILPDAECSADMYKTAVHTLKSCGLDQYEISAFARNGLYSNHNVGYWTGRPFLGFGPSAFSYWDNKRFRSVAQFNRYLDALKKGRSPMDFSEELSPKDKRNELLAIALRLRKGVNCAAFELQYGPLDPTTHDALKKLVNQGLLKQEGQTFSLTDHGVLFYDTIAVEII